MTDRLNLFTAATKRYLPDLREDEFQIDPQIIQTYQNPSGHISRLAAKLVAQIQASGASTRTDIEDQAGVFEGEVFPKQVRLGGDVNFRATFKGRINHGFFHATIVTPSENARAIGKYDWNTLRNGWPNKG